ncbi:hypothetical protein JCM19240_2912 [Vibrio maritimus]|uniref:DUF3293 domain-containing protein n=1 Tax=Vibrio maritimus TaxID=990268 RepID=A0A090TFE7_9VIBR|nr:hypothetical protein JCM19240_2912 [Vibrio maritimus]
MSIDAQLWSAYSSIAMRFLTEWECDSYAVITACNPRSRKLSDEENCIKNRELERNLADFCHVSVNVGDPSFEWVEASFAVDIPFSQACELAQKYEQNAIYWVENGVLFLVSCDEDQTKKNLGLLSQYVRQ